ncbi:sulfur carrier protein ThiS [Caldichromatium japonicum]|uniref:Sulfur carrier protein ThiS n=1 Tax=Caldichromatium japonicum TaxID=2699430 RepID=A0A6G7VF22_9GAMM|nr:sulfur carrier protein ThiS [Caldichromatium japonicum]QIK38621.1 sulfur carrier protein ThiS [Caldichromatium japonicum]
MQIFLNGTSHEVDEGLCLLELIQSLDLAGRRIAVEVNAALVPRSQFAAHRLAAGDKVEIIQAVGGG